MSDLPRAGISEVWLVNLPDQCVEQHADPHGTHYDTGRVLRGGMHVTPADESAAVIRWAERAEQGHAGAQLLLGMAYYDGDGVPQSLDEAARWYRAAAEQGNADAQRMLGDLYFDGEGVPQDDAEAIRWWRLAADQGDADAHGWLGYTYYYGLGVPQDYAEHLARIAPCRRRWWNWRRTTGPRAR